MSKFNPATWLNRSRLYSNSSGDFSTNDSTTLVGVNYTSQSTLDIGSPSPAKSHSHQIVSDSQLSLNHSRDSLGLSPSDKEGSSNSNSNNSGNTSGVGAGASPATSLPASKRDLLRQWKYDGTRSRANTGSHSHSHSHGDDGDGPGTGKAKGSHYISNDVLSNEIDLEQHQLHQHGQQARTLSKKHVRHVSVPGVSTYHKSQKNHRNRQQHGHRNQRQSSDEVDYSISMDTSDEDDDHIENDNHKRQIRPRQIDRNESFGNVSHISGLSADDTHCGFDDGLSHIHNPTRSHSHGHTHRSASSGSDNQKSFEVQHLHGPIGARSPRTSHRVHPLLNPRDEKMQRGRDFGDAFDHLVDNMNTANIDSSGRPNTHHGHRHGHHRSNTNASSGTSSDRRINRNLQRPTHLRAHTDSMALSRPYMLQGNRNSTGSANKSKMLPAHATLRERIAKPMILQSRSTSNTVQSYSSTSTSGGNGKNKNKNGVVWNGQPMHMSSDQHHSLPNVPSAGSATGSGNGSYRSMSTDNEESRSNTSNSQHSASNSGYKKHNDLLGTRQRRCLRTQNSATSDVHDGDNKSLSLQDVPEDDPSTKWNDAKSMDGRSVLSGSTTTSSRGRVIKDEIKFIVTKFVPARLRKGRNKSVSLERSEGCLT